MTVARVVVGVVNHIYEMCSNRKEEKEQRCCRFHFHMPATAFVSDIRVPLQATATCVPFSPTETYILVKWLFPREDKRIIEKINKHHKSKCSPLKTFHWRTVKGEAEQEKGKWGRINSEGANGSSRRRRSLTQRTKRTLGEWRDGKKYEK